MILKEVIIIMEKNYLIDVNNPAYVKAVSKKGNVYKVRENTELDSIKVEKNKNITSVYFPELSSESLNEVVEFFKDIHIDFIFSFSEKYRNFWHQFSKRKNIDTNIKDHYITAANKLQTRKKVNKIAKNKVKVYTVEEFLNQGGAYPSIIKPIKGKGSEHVSLIQNEAELKKLLSSINEDEFFIEEYVDGIEISIEAIHVKGQHFIYGVTETLQYEGSFVEKGHISNIRTLSEDDKQELYKIFDTLNYYNTVSHTEVFITDQGIVYIESHPRLAGGLIPTLTEENFEDDFYEIILDVFMDKLTIDEIKTKDNDKLYFSFFPVPSVFPSQVNLTEEYEQELKDYFGIKLIVKLAKNGSVISSLPKNSLERPIWLSGGVNSNINCYNLLKELDSYCKNKIFSQYENQ